MTTKQPKMTKIRIAVAVDYRGHYGVGGWKGAANDEAMESAYDSLASQDEHNGGHQRYWVEIEVPTPQAMKFLGTVQVEAAGFIEEEPEAA